MTSISRSRLRLVFIVLALCAVLSVVPLAAAQSEPLPMPETDRRNWRQAASRNFDVFGTVRAPNGNASEISVTKFGSPGAIQIRLNAQPPAPVTLHYTGFTRVIMQPKTLTFTPENWDVVQTVNVHVEMSYISNDYDYSNVSFSETGPAMYWAEMTHNDVYYYNRVEFNRFRIRLIDAQIAIPSGPIVVTTLADSITQNINGSLRQAIHLANARGGTQTINFQAGLTGELRLAADLPRLKTHILTINGSGEDILTINGRGRFDTFPGGGSALTVRRMTIENVPTVADMETELTMVRVNIRNSGPRESMIGSYSAIRTLGPLSLNRVLMEDNQGFWGGAVFAYDYTVVINNSTFRNNRTFDLNVYQGPSSSRGGGALYADSLRRLRIENSTFANNSSNNGGAIMMNGYWYAHDHIIMNSTFSNNVATDPLGTVAIDTGFNPVRIMFNTFSGHNAGAGSGGVIRSASRYYEPTIVQGNVFAHNSEAEPLECVGNIDGLMNFSGDVNCSDIAPMGLPTGVDPILQDNGGLTMTHALLPESNVIDSDYMVEGETMCDQLLSYGGVLRDQRGWERPQFDACDLGAFEDALLPLPPANLLTNPSFEAAGATETEALGWTTRNLRPIDQRWCDTLTASEGGCAFRFRGPNLTAAQRRLIQTVPADGTWGAAGDTLVLSADIRTREWGAASRLMLTVTYTDGTTETTITRIPAGTNAYQTLTASLTLTKPAASATVLVRVKTGGTKQSRLWVDNVMLVSQ